MYQSHLSLLIALFSTSLAFAADKVDYLTEIKPLLSEKCYSCHGALKQESDLRLETLELMLERDVVAPGDPEASELLTVITADDDQRMPPAESGAALQSAQVELITRWIRQGAHAPEETPPPAPTEHWAFQPFAPPDMASAISSGQHPIDAILDAKRTEHGFQSVGQADRSILIRRLYLDLVGLPPTQKQLLDDRPWDQIVDELLASPQYGERWARHWMDVWRYSDWYGLGAQIRNSQKHMWHWRDWIVRSVNDDKPYDQMIQEMLAGDELSPSDPDAIAGTGFLARNYYLFNRTTWLDSTIEHTGKAFLGLTINCAKCHDHKYDPISQLDYYRFRAILEPHQVRLDPIPGVTDFEKDGLPRAYDDSIDQPTFLHVRGDPQNPDKDNPISPGVPAILASFAPPIEPIQLPREAFAPGTRDYVQQASIDKSESAIKSAEKELAAARKRLSKNPPTDAKPESGKPTPFEITDSFDQANPDLWQLIGDNWEYRDGALHQTKSTRDAQMVRLVPTLPRAFEVECAYTTTGGSTYKSVTFRFDQSEDSKNSNFVYTSAHEPGPKVHVAFRRNGSDTYPPKGMKAKPIKVGQRYRLRFAVRDTLVNVWLDDEFVVAYQLPDRPQGFFSLSGFDATVAFDQITIKSLATETKLTPASNKKVASPADAKIAVKAAELKLAAAVAKLQSVQATIEADTARYDDSESTVDADSFAAIAAQKQLAAKIADADFRLVADASDAKKLKAAKDQKAAAEKQLQQLDPADPKYQSLRGSKKALETPAHKEPDYPAVYSPVSSGRRLALARWMTSEQNPLTARVAVNHVWMRHFGTPLVETVFDFGLRCKKPIHADLLDFLAADFIDSGWSFKHLHRMIVTCDAYRLSSSALGADPHTRDADKENQYYWRANARRMESQLVRDTLLQLAGKMDPKMGGPSVDPNSATTRRSLYLKHSRDQQDKFLKMFDDADILQCYQRTESIVPQQALALSNSKIAIESSIQIADKVAESAKQDPTKDFIGEAFMKLLCRAPSSEERSECESFIDAMSQLPEMQSLDQAARMKQIRPRLIAAIMNHNDFVTIR